MLHTAKLRPRVVEFIIGTGVVTDGIVDATSTSGPWTYTLPPDVSEFVLDGCGAGAAGSDGGAVNVFSAGGAGGATGLQAQGVRLQVLPGGAITVTLVAGGTRSGGAASATGVSTVSGLLPGHGPYLTTAGVFSLYGASSIAQGASSPSTAQAGRAGGISNFVMGGSQATAGAATAGTGGSANAPAGYSYCGGTLHVSNGGASGGTAAVGTSAGGSGGSSSPGNSFDFGLIGNSSLAGGTGSTTGTNSYSGGGAGASGKFGRGGVGGNGAGNGGAGAGYGFGGGGGGGGGGSGSNGGNAYVRITFMTAY